MLLESYEFIFSKCRHSIYVQFVDLCLQPQISLTTISQRENLMPSVHVGIVILMLSGIYFWCSPCERKNTIVLRTSFPISFHVSDYKDVKKMEGKHYAKANQDLPSYRNHCKYTETRDKSLPKELEERQKVATVKKPVHMHSAFHQPDSVSERCKREQWP